MRKRIVGEFMSLILTIFLIPALALNVFAASNLSTSDSAVSLIKQYEGFSAKAFWDVSQWSIGYGTVGSPGQTISEAEADAALRRHLVNVDVKLNEFAERFNLNFTQAQHDALASLSFNCGTGWMNENGRFRQAVIDGVTGNEFLFAVSLWANVASVPDSGLLNRRLSEANLYLNGVYEKNPPAEYGYVIFNPNGGTPGNGGEDKMQGYIVGSNADILAAAPTKSGTTFVGWFTDPVNGTEVSTLNAATSGKVLYAHYADGSYSEGIWGSGSDSDAVATGVVVCDTYVNVRSGAGTANRIVDRAYNGTRVTILEIVTSGGRQWGRTSGGWICMDYVRRDAVTKPNNGQIGAPGVVANAGVVNVRSAAGTANQRVTTLNRGTKVTVYEQVTKDNAPWGRIDQGWICMYYVQLESGSTNNDSGSDAWDKESPSDGSSIVTGTVISTTNLNVRTGPGVNYTQISSLRPGSSVTVYEKRTTNGVVWGRIGENRWVCMNYVSEQNTECSDSIGTGKVTSSTGLNVRSGAGTGNPVVSALRHGDQVTVYEEKNVGGVKWGRIGTNRWVCMTYIQMDGQSSNSGDSSAELSWN